MGERRSSFDAAALASTMRCAFFAAISAFFIASRRCAAVWSSDESSESESESESESDSDSDSEDDSSAGGGGAFFPPAAAFAGGAAFVGGGDFVRSGFDGAPFGAGDADFAGVTFAAAAAFGAGAVAVWSGQSIRQTSGNADPWTDMICRLQPAWQVVRRRCPSPNRPQTRHRHRLVVWAGQVQETVSYARRCRSHPTRLHRHRTSRLARELQPPRALPLPLPLTAQVPPPQRWRCRQRLQQPDRASSCAHRTRPSSSPEEQSRPVGGPR
ncbi:hypothetical protein EXIGLDRAFT_385243 [Exidia glandulosa HHB12029]|uniref:Uncharacterized protein n=1 Tax=Exidia glandulosa HHB12029 TaxID=1314781 RepID=A0A165BW78_EXIGL|nr:hypothetical protein EXIGLDRAFT_385243 [Exidia glandulosa HHB12029]